MCTCAEQKYNCEVVVILVDFSDGMEIYPNIAEQLQDLDIGILSKPYILCIVILVTFEIMHFSLQLTMLVLHLSVLMSFMSDRPK